MISTQLAEDSVGISYQAHIQGVFREPPFHIYEPPPPPPPSNFQTPYLASDSNHAHF